MMSPEPRIGTLNEAPLHADLKAQYARTGDRPEARVDGFVIEIQTGRLGALRAKLERLLATHPVRVVSPIPVEKWLLKRSARPGGQPERRKSPKQGTLIDVFRQWTGIAALMGHPHLSLEVLLTREEEVRRFDGKRGWRRRGWVVEERRLLAVVARHRFDSPDALQALLPAELPTPFDTADLAKALAVRRELAQKMAYVLRKCGAIQALGRQRSGILYAPPSDAPS